MKRTLSRSPDVAANTQSKARRNSTSTNQLNISSPAEYSAGLSSASIAQRSVGVDPQLQKWYEEYRTADAEDDVGISVLLETIDSDELEVTNVENRISELALTTNVERGFCVSCRNALDNWPAEELESDPEIESDGELESESESSTGSSVEPKLDEDTETYLQEASEWKRAVARHCCSFELEASMRNGCQFCAFLLQLLKDSDLLDRFRKVEFRLGRLNDPAGISLSVSTMLSTQSLWLNLPGKVSNDGDIGIARQTRFEANIVSGPEFIKLTPQTYQSFLSSIPADQFPRTFKDAIDIGRKLGIDYLWIDSLCIIQGDDIDWQKEAAKMGSVYGNSYLNIAASSAKDSTQGCFTKPAKFNGGFRAEVKTSDRRRVLSFRCEDLYEQYVTESYLATRAWTLQEKVLAPRTLHIGDRGIFWECRTRTASEFLPDEIMDTYEPFRGPLISQVNRQTTDFWIRIVRLYSAASLTYEKDKLPALSGVARFQHMRSNDQYLAGMWKTNIESQLCWQLVETPKKRPAWRAPTWTWASVDGGVACRDDLKHEYEFQDDYAHVLEASTIPLGLDSFGQVKDGELRLCCSAMLAGSIDWKAKHRNPETDAATATVNIHNISNQQTLPFWKDCSDDLSQGSAETVYFLPILGGKSQENTRSKAKWRTGIHGMVLRKTGSIAGRFSRIGSFDFYEDTAWNWKEMRAYYELFTKMIDECGDRTANAACARKISTSIYANEPYTITIV
ncbi:MAG: hypothetical protein M1820_007030 [Bogoriella megaspora]|nr:MAG: hypothetical protein M1820_007030 [Bogoriella megaspora]